MAAKSIVMAKVKPAGLGERMASNYLISGNGTDGAQLWVIDPATGSFSKLLDLYPGQYDFHYYNGSGPTIAPRTNNASPHDFATFNGGVLFSAAGPSQGTELWISDGTIGGTHLVADINPGSVQVQKTYSGGSNTLPYTKTVFNSSNPNSITSLGNTAVFVANDGTDTSGLWVTNGTAAGTQRLAEVANQSEHTFATVSGKALFSGVYNNSQNNELWITDGTSAGTYQLAAINPSGAASVNNLTSIGDNQVLFSATDGASPNEVWVSDGTAAGTHLVADIQPGALSGTPRDLTPFGPGSALFIANDGIHGYEPWIFTNGSASLLKDVDAGSGDVFSSGANLNVVNWPGFDVFTTSGGQTEALFSGYTARAGQELWITDGTASGTKLLSNISPDTGGVVHNSGPGFFTNIDSRVVFTAHALSYNSTIWTTDGTATGTTQLLTNGGHPLYAGYEAGGAGGNQLDAKLIGGELFVVASYQPITSGATPYLWATDGTTAGTHMVSTLTSTNIPNLVDAAAPCYLKGTRILTAAGEVSVETLRPGDLVMTFDGAARPIRWIGTRRLAQDQPGWRTALPVLIREGALADNMPKRNLYVSPDHAIYLAGMLIPAQFLVNGRTIVRSKTHQSIEYFHIELDGHNVILAEGVPAETYRDDGNRRKFDNAPVTLLETFTEIESYAPLVEDGMLLEDVQRYLNERAELLGYQATTDPDLRLIADGKTVRPTERHGDPEQDEIFTFELETPPKKLSIRSNVAVPAEVVGSNDWRRLGVAISRIILSTEGMTIEIDHIAPFLTEGFHAKENLQRWTEGDAKLPASLFAAIAGPMTIEIHVREKPPYVTANAGSAILEIAARAQRTEQSTQEAREAEADYAALRLARTDDSPQPMGQTGEILNVI